MIFWLLHISMYRRSNNSLNTYPVNMAYYLSPVFWGRYPIPTLYLNKHRRYFCFLLICAPARWVTRICILLSGKLCKRVSLFVLHLIDRWMGQVELWTNQGDCCLTCRDYDIPGTITSAEKCKQWKKAKDGTMMVEWFYWI